MLLQPVSQGATDDSRFRGDPALATALRNGLADVDWTAELAVPVSFGHGRVGWKLSRVVDHINSRPGRLAHGGKRFGLAG